MPIHRKTTTNKSVGKWRGTGLSQDMKITHFLVTWHMVGTCGYLQGLFPFCLHVGSLVLSNEQGGAESDCVTKLPWAFYTLKTEMGLSTHAIDEPMEAEKQASCLRLARQSSACL